MAIIIPNFEFQLSLLLFLSLMGYIIASRLGQSIIIGEILIGIAVGPSVLGIITYTEFTRTLASMGAIFLLFVVGLELKFKEIYNGRSVVIAFLGVLFPWIGGFAAAQFFGFSNVESLFIGTALTATSIAITANVLKEMGKLDSQVAKAIIGAAVVDDVLALLALSLTTQFASNAVSWEAIGFKFAVAIAFIVLAGILGNILSTLLVFADKWALRKKIPQLTFILAMTIAFFYSFAAEVVGLSAIVGAFIAGVSLENAKIESYRTGSKYMEILFSSIFFVSLGILFEVKALVGILPFVAILFIVAVITKFFGGYLGARLFRMGEKDARAVGTGMIPRGEVALIVALIGLSAGVISNAAYSAIIVVGILTTLVTPPMLSAIWKGKTETAKG